MKLVFTIVLLGLISSLCLPTAGDAAVAATSTPSSGINVSAVVEQRSVILDEATNPGTPTVPESQAITLATSYLGTSGQVSSIQTNFTTLTVRGDKGEVAWGIEAQPAWLVTFQGVAYPAANGASDCSCQAYYWRPNTVVAVDANTGAKIIKLGVSG